MTAAHRSAWRAGGTTLPFLAGTLALAAYSAFGASNYGIRLMTVSGVYALLVLGYQLIFGHAGALSLAHGAFFGLGAYVTGVLGGTLGWGFAATFPLSLLAPLLLAAFVAAPVLRLQSHYFALATLGIAQVLRLVAVTWQDVTGGANGLPGIPGIAFLGVAVPRGLPLLALVWALVGVGALAAARLGSSAWAQGLFVQRENPLAAAASGLDSGLLRFAAFLLSALYAGAAGALYAHATGVVSPEVMGFPIMVTCLTMAVVGGRTRIAGAILGALLLVHLPEWLRGVGALYLMAYGAALLAAIIVAPEGLAGLFARLVPVGQTATEQTVAAAAPFAADPPPRGTPVLTLRGLARRYGGVAALAGVDIEVASGEIVGLIGPNGSGKTTLVNLASGFDSADAGTIRLGGAEIGGKPAATIARSGIGRTFQAGALVDDLSLLDAVALAHLAGRGGITLRDALAGGERHASSRNAAHCLLERLDLAAAAPLPCGALSLSERHRAEIARALALAPRILLLDEPAAGLAAAELAVLAQQLRALARDGLALLVIEHNMSFLMPLADRIVCLDAGRIIATGTPAEIQADGAVAAAYLGGDPSDPPPDSMSSI